MKILCIIKRKSYIDDERFVFRDTDNFNEFLEAINDISIEYIDIRFISYKRVLGRKFNTTSHTMEDINNYLIELYGMMMVDKYLNTYQHGHPQAITGKIMSYLF